ncbi:MAG: prolipoprotein diacylglyceryl transferase [Phycisphaerales bacterium]|nr:MAG: prolipoprotein diacylglyceryl transferase [Phycisphaerales bacterium]
MPTLAAYFHDINPFLVRFTPSFGIRWYGLSYALGFVIAWLVLLRLTKRGVVRLAPERLGDAMLTLMLGVLVGGRLGYSVFYDRPLLWTFTKSAPWWSLLDITNGGMASHGGMIGVLIATWIIWRREKRAVMAQSGTGVTEAAYNASAAAPYLHFADAWAFVAPFGLMLGRLANFINGELLGRIVAKAGEDAPWWAVRYPQEITSGQATNLTQAQQGALDTIIAKFRTPNGDMEHAAKRMIEAIQDRGFPGRLDLIHDLTPYINARAPSQLVQAMAEGPVLLVALWIIWAKPRSPGMVAAAFLIVYGILRIATEFVRLPDPGVAGLMGLSRGQALSVAMIVVGIAFATLAVRLAKVGRVTPLKLGGWLHPALPAGASSRAESPT